MSVPETAVNQDGGLIAGKNQIGFSRQVPDIQPVAEAAGEQGFSDQQFRAGVLISDCPHILGTNLPRMDIRHGQAALLTLPCPIRFAFRIRDFIRRATAAKTGTTTELPNCLYACVSDTGILNAASPGPS